MNQGTPRPEEPRQVIELWQEPTRLWRWRYREPSSDGQPLTFLSNKEYESRELALRSATTAYPDVAVVEPGGPSLRRRRGRIRARLVLLAVFALVVFLLRPRRRRPVPR
jgi:hypothetical protein